MKKGGKRLEEKGSGLTAVAGSLAKGATVALGAALLLLMGCAAAVSAQWLGQQTMEGCMVMACILGALAGGFVAMSGHREWAMALGPGTGGMLFLMLLALGMLLYENAPILERVPSICSACLCGGTMAGILGRKSKKKRRR